MIAIEGYEQIEHIGHGGLGDVYRAVRTSTGATVAIKVLHDVSDQSVAWHRTRRELTALVTLAGHGNVVRLLELLDLPSGPALVMEYAPGGSVARLLERRALTVGEIALIGRHTAAALQAAHEQGIVHRDVKPQNLLVDAYGQVRLCDFGIASLARTDEFRTRTNALSTRYASPEDLDDGEVGPAADVYSLGATLLHLAHGAPPTIKERLVPWTAPATDDPELAGLDGVIEACLRPDPEERPTAGEVLGRLEQLDVTLTTRARALVVEPPADEGAPGPFGPVDRPGSGPGDGRPALDATGGGALAESVTAPTILRAERRASARAATGVSRSGARHPAGWVAAAGAVGAVVVAVWIVWLGGSRADAPGPAGDATSPSTTAGSPGTTGRVAAVSRPTGLADIGALVWPLGPVGECLVQPTAGDALVGVPCDEPHDLQRIATGELDPTSVPDGSDFDEAAIDALVTEACHAAFLDTIGVDVVTSELDAPLTRPSAATWAGGDRRYQCFVGIAGLRLVGDAIGSGQ